jgi:hypothetical protein
VDRILWLLKYLNNFSKGFSATQEAVFLEIREPFKEMLMAVLNIMNGNIRVPQVCEQALQFL